MPGTDPARIQLKCCSAAWKHSRSYPSPPAHLPAGFKSRDPRLPHHKLQERQADHWHLSWGTKSEAPTSNLPPSSASLRLLPFVGPGLESQREDTQLGMGRLGETVV